MHRLIFSLLLMAVAQAATFDDCRAGARDFLKDRDATKLVNASSECLKDEISDRLNLIIAREANVLTQRNVLRLLEASRIDKQLGGTGAASGSTSVGSSPSAPSLLSIAVESGAVSQSTSGTVTTVRGNGLGLARLLLGNDQFVYCSETQKPCEDRSVPILKSLSFAVGFDTSRQSTVRAPTEGSANAAAPAAPKPIALLTGGPSRVESLQFRYDLFNRRDLHDPQYWSAWEKIVTPDGPLKTALRASAKAAGENFLLYEFIPSTAYRDNVLAPLALRLARAQTEAQVIVEFMTAATEALDLIAKLPDFAAKARTEFVALQNLRAAQDAIALEARKTMSASIEYNFLRPREQPEQSNIKFVLAGSPFRKDLKDGLRVPNKDVLLSANFGIEFYNELPAGTKVGRLRDFQMSGQIDRKVPQAFSGADAVLTVAGYWQYQVDNALIKIGPGQIVPGTGIVLPGEAATLLAPKGHLGIVQGKFTLQFKDSGVKFPIAITWASRTQLINASDVRGNIGIAFDLDKLIFHR